MPKFTFTSPEGKSFTVEGPEGSTAEQAFSILQQRIGTQSQAPQSGPTEEQKRLSSTPMRLAKGGFDPIAGGAQLASRIPGAEYVNKAADAVGGFLNRNVFNKVGLPGDFAGEVLGIRGATPEQLDREIKDAEAEYQAARVATAPKSLRSLVTGEAPDPGADLARLAGNVLSPANAVAARGAQFIGGVRAGLGLAPISSLAGRAAAGGAAGAAGAAAQPVLVDEGGSYGAQKAAQTAVGAAAGAALSPLLGAIGDRVAQFFANRGAERASRAASPAEVEAIARRVANDTNQRWEDLGPQLQEQMRSQVQRAMSNGGRRDPAAMARAADFQAEGMQGTLGQVTRDPRQFANEMNLRQVPNTGDPLLQRFQQQGQQLQEKVGSYTRGAQSEYQAGQSLIKPLRAYDEKLSTDIRAAYRGARESAGKDAELPLQGLAQDTAQILEDFGDKVPSGVVNSLKRYGILPDQTANPAPRKLFTVEEADRLLKLINSSGSRTDDATNAALSQLRSSIRGAVESGGADDVFAPARKLAAQRFALHDSVDALNSVASGKANPDNFVNRFVVNGQTDQTIQLAKILKDQSPEAYQQARSQIGAKLSRAAFGENVSGDKPFAAERYATALREIGDEKLGAFFNAKELEQLHRLGRIGSYINQAPNKAPVNTSGNWGAIMNIVGRIPGLPAAVGLVQAGRAAYQTNAGVQQALSAQVPNQAAELSAPAVRRLSDLTTAVGAGAGVATASK